MESNNVYVAYTNTLVKCVINHFTVWAFHPHRGVEPQVWLVVAGCYWLWLVGRVVPQLLSAATFQAQHNSAVHSFLAT